MFFGFATRQVAWSSIFLVFSLEKTFRRANIRRGIVRMVNGKFGRRRWGERPALCMIIVGILVSSTTSTASGKVNEKVKIIKALDIQDIGYVWFVITGCMGTRICTAFGDTRTIAVCNRSGKEWIFWGVL